MAVLIVAAIRPWKAPGNPNYDIRGLNLFSYFTVQSNFIAAAVLLIAAYALLRRKTLGNWFSYARGGAVLYMLITGVVYSLLLENNEGANASLSFDWKNFVLHKLAPLFVVIWWLMWPSKKSVSARQTLYWLIFPLAWLIYTMVRGAAIDWYPYPFLDPAKAGGTLGVSLHIGGIFIGFLLFSQLVAWLSRVRLSSHSSY